MSKITYKLKEKYTNISICPGVKVLKLADLTQKQIQLVVSQGHTEYFEEVKPTKKDK